MRQGTTLLLAGLTLGAAAMVTLGTAGVATAAGTACNVNYEMTGEWPASSPTAGGFIASLHITNLGAPLTAWQLDFDFVDPGQQVADGWNLTWSQAERHVTATNKPWNGSVSTNTRITAGVLGTWTGANPAPVNFTLNGTPCATGPVVEVPTSPPVSPSGQEPSIRLSNLAYDQVFTAPATILMETVVDDPEGLFARVDFVVGGTVICSDTTAPYACTAENVTTLGWVRIHALAYDDAGTVRSSSTVEVYLRAPGTSGDPTLSPSS